MEEKSVGIKGRIEDMGLADIIQVLHNERKSVGIHLGSERGYGSVFMQEGELVHAAYRDVSGKEALARLLGWEDGDFEVDQDEVAPDVTLNEPIEALLLDAMKEIDESRGRGAEYRGYGEDTESAKLISTLLELGILERKG